jgi:hypothetical protein
MFCGFASGLLALDVRLGQLVRDTTPELWKIVGVVGRMLLTSNPPQVRENPRIRPGEIHPGSKLKGNCDLTADSQMPLTIRALCLSGVSRFYVEPLDVNGYGRIF